MNLTERQIELLEAIQGKLVRGDIETIAENTGLSRVWVSKVLSLSHDSYDEDIVTEAVRLISVREQNTEKLLKKLTA